MNLYLAWTIALVLFLVACVTSTTYGMILEECKRERREPPSLWYLAFVVALCVLGALAVRGAA